MSSINWKSYSAQKEKGQSEVAMKFETVFGNDKNWVIMAVFGLGMYSLYMLGIEAKEIVTNVVSGLMGIAVGQAITK